MSVRIVVLAELDGFEFEDLCKNIFESLGYLDVRLGPRISDAGRDIVMRSPAEEVVIVECKHHLGRVVGRPVVQKLHSAIITHGASRGMLVTTGYFSKEAVEYVTENGLPIDLVDINSFKKMAEEAGFAVYETRREADAVALFAYLPSEAIEIVEGEIDKMISHPYKPSELVSLSSAKLVYNPVYIVGYSVYSEAYTSTGRLIGVIDASGEILVDGGSGDPLGSPRELLGQTRAVARKSAEPGMFKPRFVSPHDVKEFVADWLVKKLTRTVIYARSGSTKFYTRVISPKRSDVKILSVAAAYVPELELEYSAAGRRYGVLCNLSAPPRRLIKQNGLERCTICSKRLPPSKRVLCNSCGAIAHHGLLTGHAFRCDFCRKTVCRQCTVKKRRWLIAKRYYCFECAYDRQVVQST